MALERVSSSNPLAERRACGVCCDATLLLAHLVMADPPGVVLDRSREQFHLFLLEYTWGSLCGSGLVYACLSFAAARGQRWRWAPPLAEIALLLVGTWGTFVPDPVFLAPFYWQFVVMVLMTCVLGESLRRTPQQKGLLGFVVFGWWLLPMLLWLPGMMALNWAVPWLQETGAALRR